MNTVFEKIVITIIISMTVTVFTGCFKSADNAPYYTISNEFAAYCWFEEDSYWIFQNDSTMIKDSVKIVETSSSIRLHNDTTAYNYQAAELFLNQNIFSIARLELTAGNYEVDPGKMNSLLRLYNNDGFYFRVFSPEYAMGEEIILGDAIGTYTNVELIESFELNGKTYNDVYHTRIVVSVNDNVEYNYWIAKNNGLVKALTIGDEDTISISLVSSSLIPHQ